MGAWGHQFDENDSAADWLADFSDSPSWQVVRKSLEQALAQANDYLEADEASEALAAAEVVSSGLGKTSQRLSDTIAKWAAAHSSEAIDLQALAGEAVLVVRDGSELSELWSEGESDEWIASVTELYTRLS